MNSSIIHWWIALTHNNCTFQTNSFKFVHSTKFQTMLLLLCSLKISNFLCSRSQQDNILFPQHTITLQQVNTTIICFSEWLQPEVNVNNNNNNNSNKNNIVNIVDKNIYNNNYNNNKNNNEIYDTIGNNNNNNNNNKNKNKKLLPTH